MGRARPRAFLAAVAWLLTAEATSGQALRLVTPRAYPIGGNPAAVVAEDLDRDGNLDIVVANYDQGTITVLRGDGKGDFTPVDDFPTLALPAQMACADFDGDKVLDLLITEPEADDIYFLRGTGNAEFDPARRVSVRPSHDPAGIVAAHMNDDDVLDAVVSYAPESGGEVGILLGGGDGTFEFNPKGTRVVIAPSYGVGVGDFTGDDLLDVAAVTLNGELTVFRGDGLGGISRGTSFATGATPFALDVADLDADDHLDVLVADGGDDTLSFMRGDGAGAFERAIVIPVGLGPATIRLFDIVGDTQLDALTANTIGGDASLVPGRGAAGFGRARHFAAPLRPFAATAGDCDENGLLDLIVASQNSSGDSAVFVMLQREHGFEAIESVSPEVRTPRLAAGDVDGDAKPDLVVGDPAASTVRILPSLGSEGFGEPIASFENVSAGPTALADLDGDGRLDLVVASSTEARAAVALSLASGGFSTPAMVTLGAPANAVEVADLDADGRLDVASVGANPAQVTVLFGDGAGGLGTMSVVSLLGSPSGLTSGDFDGDGKQDLAVGNAQRNEVTLLLARAGRTFEPVAPGLAVQAASLAAGDLDVDGADDLVVTGGVNSTIQLLVNDGRGNFSAGPSVSAGGFASSLSLRDLTGDSLPDVIVTLQTAGAVAIAINRGNRFLAAPIPFLVGIRPSGTIGADFDADGRYDLATEGDGAWVITNASDLRAIRGDGNGDRRTSAADVVALFAELGERRRQPAERVAAGEIASATGLDANGDGFVDSSDLSALLREVFVGG